MAHRGGRGTGRSVRWRLAGFGTALVGAVLAFAGLVAVPGMPGMAPAAAAPAVAVNRDINSYVLFAYDDLNFGGRDAGPTRGFIDGGNVGVNNPDTTAHGSQLNMCAAGRHQVVMSDGTQAVADTASLSSACSLYDLYTNRLSGNPPVVPRHAGPMTFSAPIVAPANLPQLPAFTCDPTKPVTVPSDSAMSLAPGVWGAVRVTDHGTLNLAAGIYTMCGLNNGKYVHINTVSGTVVRIAGSFSSNNESFVGPACDAQFLVRSDGVSSNDSSVSYGRNSEVHGLFFAPNGRLNLGHSSDLFGHFWAKTMGSDWNVNVHHCKGSLTVEKQSVGGVGTFNFSLVGPAPATTDQGPRAVSTVGHQGSFVAAAPWSDLTPGTYTLAEASPGAGWQVGPFACMADGQVVASGPSPLSVPVAAGQAVDCKIVNTTAPGSLTVVKTTTGDVGTFGFGLRGPAPAVTDQGARQVTTLTDGVAVAAAPWSGLSAGTYVVSENDPGAAWEPGPFACSVGAQVVASGVSPLAVPVGAGQSVVCRITNVYAPKGSITVEKTTLGGTGTFSFTLDGGAARQVSTVQAGVAVQAAAWTNLDDVAHVVAESDPGAGWTPGAFSCVDAQSNAVVASGVSPLSVPLGLNEAVLCRITNTAVARTGSVTVRKTSVGGMGRFSFTLTGQAGRQVVTTQDSVAVAGAPWTGLAGSYTLAETDPGPAWFAGGFDCTDGLSHVSGPAPVLSVAGAQDWICDIVNVATGCGVPTVAGTKTEPTATNGPAPGTEPVAATPPDNHPLHTAC